MRKRDGYTGDIEWASVYAGSVLGLIIAVVILALVTGAIALAAHDDKKTWQNNTTAVQRFNDLQRHERIIIAEWTGISDELDDQDQRVYPECPSTFTERMSQALPFYPFVILIAMSIGLFYGYHEEKGSSYFYADLPREGKHTWVLFLGGFACWLIFLASYIHMRYWQAQKVLEEQEKIQRIVADNQKAIEKAKASPQDYATREDLTAQTEVDQASCMQFVEYCQKDNQDTYRRKLNDLSEGISHKENRLRDYGHEIQELQRKIKQDKLELDLLKASGPPPERPIIALKSDWYAIKAMRGVIAISTRNEYRDRLTLAIQVAVRVPYEGETYDFGDFEITISADSFDCMRKRSGVRSDYRGGYPDYCYNYGERFCLGERKATIQNYVTERKVRAAVALIIDCLHSVNNAEEAARIPQCFRLVVPIEKEG